MNHERPRRGRQSSLGGLLGSITFLAVILALVRAGIVDEGSRLPLLAIGLCTMGGAFGGWIGSWLYGPGGTAPGILLGALALLLGGPAIFVIWLWFFAVY